MVQFKLMNGQLLKKFNRVRRDSAKIKSSVILLPIVVGLDFGGNLPLEYDPYFGDALYAISEIKLINLENFSIQFFE